MEDICNDIMFQSKGISTLRFLSHHHTLTLLHLHNAWILDEIWICGNQFVLIYFLAITSFILYFSKSHTNGWRYKILNACKSLLFSVEIFVKLSFIIEHKLECQYMKKLSVSTQYLTPMPVRVVSAVWGPVWGPGPPGEVVHAV